MSEETGNQAPATDSVKGSVLEEEKKLDNDSSNPPVKEAPIPIINPGFRGIFPLKSKKLFNLVQFY